jgi:hypothetical protein
MMNVIIPEVLPPTGRPPDPRRRDGAVLSLLRRVGIILGAVGVIALAFISVGFLMILAGVVALFLYIASLRPGGRRDGSSARLLILRSRSETRGREGSGSR